MLEGVYRSGNFYGDVFSGERSGVFLCFVIAFSDCMALDLSSFFPGEKSAIAGYGGDLRVD